MEYPEVLYVNAEGDSENNRMFYRTHELSSGFFEYCRREMNAVAIYRLERVISLSPTLTVEEGAPDFAAKEAEEAERDDEPY